MWTYVNKLFLLFNKINLKKINYKKLPHRLAHIIAYLSSTVTQSCVR